MTVPAGMVAPLVYHSPPNVVSSAGVEAIEFAESCGIVLDDWQQWAVMEALAERAGGKWAAFEVGLVMPRQNGKNYFLRTIQLAALFLFGDRTLFHTAHQFDTCEEHRTWLMELLESHPEFGRRLKPTNPRTGRSASFVNNNGQEQIVLKSVKDQPEQRIMFKARSGGKGRGFTGAKVFFDECQELKASMMGDTVPVLSTVSGAQIYYTGSAAKPTSQISHAVRNRALGDDPDDRLMYAEYGNGPEVLDFEPGSPEYMAAIERANPAVDAGRIGHDYIEQEIRTFSGDPDLVEEHKRERLGIATPPKGKEDFVRPIDLEAWSKLVSVNVDYDKTTAALAIAVAYDRSWSTISAVGKRPDGLVQGKVVAMKPGTGWVAERVAELAAERKGTVVGMVKDEPLVDDVEKAGVTVTAMSGADQARASQSLIDACSGGIDDEDGLAPTFRHRGEPALATAVGIAVPKPYGGGNMDFDNRKSPGDISPLKSMAMAYALCMTAPAVKRSVYEDDDLLMV